MYNVKSSNLFHFLSIVTLLFGSLVVGIIFEIFNQLGNPVSPVVTIGTSQLLLVLGPVLIYFLVKKGFLKNSLYLKNPGLVNSLLAILLTFVLLPTVGLLNVISMFFVKNHIADALGTLTQYPYILSLTVVAFFPGIFEEFSTRFILLNNYRHKPYYIACIMSGLFFGIIHLNVNQFIYAFVLGTLFAFLIQITESVFTTILMHIVLNATSLTSGYLMKGTPQVSAAPDWQTLVALLGVNVITIPIAIFIILFLIGYNGKKGILKLKPTSLELTLGRKLPEYQPQSNTGMNPSNPPMVQNPWQPQYDSPEYYPAYPPEDDSPFMPNSEVNISPSTYPDAEYAERYLAKSDSPFNWAFWSSVILFLVLTVLSEILPRLLPQ